MIALLMTEAVPKVESLGARVRRLRLEHIPRWSQSDLSMASKVPQTTIHKIETGETVAPRIDTLKLIAEALEVSVRELMEGTEPISIGGDDWESRDIRLFAPNLPLAEAQEFLEDLDNLDINGRRAVQALIDGLLRAEQANKNEGSALEG